MPACVAVFWLLFSTSSFARAQAITIDGSQTYQTLDGLGANIHYFAWTNRDLVPVLDALIDQGGLTMFRVVFDNTDWEAANVYVGTNPSTINWNYFNTIYASDRFQRLWGLIRYLNQKGISNGVMLNFQGASPAWMGDPLTPGYEDAWAQMIASLLVYARNTEHLQFSLLGPGNEMNYYPYVQGVATSGPGQYVTMLHDLANQLDYNGLGDFRIVGPDLANSTTNWMPDMMSDPVVMAKVAHFSVHDYTEGTDSAGVTNWLALTAYADRSLWVTEYNAYCPSCADGQGNSTGWAYALGTAEYLLAHLANGATSALVWEGYDSYEATEGPGWSYWGLFGVDDINAVSKTYTAREDFHTVAQIAKYLQPGAQQIGVAGQISPLILQAYYNAGSAQLSIVGVNPNATTASLACTLASLPEFSSLNLYYTDPNTNLALAATVPVINGGFSVTVPANCVFAINGRQVPPVVPSLQSVFSTNGLTLKWPGTATNFTLVTTTNPAPNAVWYPVANSPQLLNGQFQQMVTPTNQPRFFRLRWP
jgi:O-glycosyl hydrolase